MTEAPRAAWRREGLLVAVEPGHPWWASHAQCPTVLPLSDRLWRIYFAARDRGNAAHIVAIDVDPGANMRILAKHLEPLLAPGPAGAFDHDGMGPSSVLAIDGRVHLFYTGVAVRRDVRFQMAIGLAASADGLRFEKMFAGPVRSTGPFDPYFVSTPSVVRNAGGFRMWYVGGVAWRPVDGTPEPFYDIRTVHSADGLAWSARPAIAVALNEPAEAGLGRPHALTYRDGTRLWYSSRSGKGGYRIVTAALDPDGIAIGAGAPLVFSNPPVAGDFDDSMQCYGCVVPHGDDLVMVYNGNDFGRFGFGWARAAGAWHAGGSRGGG